MTKKSAGHWTALGPNFFMSQDADKGSNSFAGDAMFGHRKEAREKTVTKKSLVPTFVQMIKSNVQAHGFNKSILELASSPQIFYTLPAATIINPPNPSGRRYAVISEFQLQLLTYLIAAVLPGVGGIDRLEIIGVRLSILAHRNSAREGVVKQQD